tara:strand:+ start:93 stop:341 length:249 start_codon:yes stop_codon:yes gene_type:complete
MEIVNTAICAGCGKGIHQREYDMGGGPFTQWVDTKLLTDSNILGRISNPQHSITDASGKLVGEQDHYPAGDDPPPVDRLYGR